MGEMAAEHPEKGVVIRNQNIGECYPIFWFLANPGPYTIKQNFLGNAYLR